MPGTLIKGNNCAVCISCHTNCTTCPTNIWLQVRGINEKLEFVSLAHIGAKLPFSNKLITEGDGHIMRWVCFITIKLTFSVQNKDF